MNSVRNRVLWITGMLLLGGCDSIGPKAMREFAPDYNEAIAKTEANQLLLNIVRLKYRDNPSFLEVNSVVENRKFTTRVGPSGSKFGLDSNSGNHEIGLLAYTEQFQNPTITMTPLKGEKFTKSMATPVSMQLVLGLMQTGWSPKRVFSLCVEKLNTLDNASSASGPTPARPPSFEKFEQSTKLINKLCKDEQLLFGIDKNDGKTLVMKFVDTPLPSNTIARLKNLLNLDESMTEFRFSSNFMDANNGSSLPVRTRSLMEILFYLSHAVQVSNSDLANGLVTQTIAKDGSVFDWNDLSGKWFQVKCSEEKVLPQNAHVCIKYRGKWFYIEDSDLNSKTTFLFLKHLFELHCGDPKVAVPNLVIASN